MGDKSTSTYSMDEIQDPLEDQYVQDHPNNNHKTMLE